MADTDSSSGKTFFTTLPGLITGLAALITAVGGLILILSKTGCFNTNSAGKNDIVQTDSSSKTKTEHTEPPVLKGQNVTYNPAEIKHATRYIAYKIMHAEIEVLPSKEIVLHLKIKCVNDSKYDYNFYATYIRVLIGEDKYASDPYSPSDNYQAVSPNSFKDLEYNYKLPAGTQKFALTFYDEAAEIGSSFFNITAPL